MLWRPHRGAWSLSLVDPLSKRCRAEEFVLGMELYPRWISSSSSKLLWLFTLLLSLWTFILFVLLLVFFVFLCVFD